MAAEGAGGRAGRVEQHRVERLGGLPVERVGGDQFGGKLRARQIVGESAKTTFLVIERGDGVARRGELHGLAAGRRAQVEDVAGVTRDRGARGARRRDPGPTSRRSPKPASSATDPALARRTMARGERNAAMRFGIGLRGLVGGEAEVERRALGDGAAGGHHRPPRPTPLASALRPARAGAARRAWARRGGAGCRARHGPGGAARRRPAAARWRPAHGRACRGRSSGPARGAAPSAPWRRRASGRWVALSIRSSRSGRRRSTSPAIASASAWSFGGRRGPRAAAASSVTPVRSTASSMCSAAWRAARPAWGVASICQWASVRGRARNCSSSASTLDPAAQQIVDRGDDRHVDAALVGEAAKDRGGERAFGHGAAVGHQLRRGAALADGLAQEKLRELVELQVSTRSPRPDSPASVSCRAPVGQAEARHFGEAARDHRGAGVLAEALALDHAAGDRQHILDRAADFGPGDIVAQIDAELRQCDAVADRFGDGRILARDRHRGRQPGGDFMGEGRSRQHRHRRVGTDGRGDIMEELAARFLDALRAEDQRLEAGRRGRQHLAHMLGRA